LSETILAGERLIGKQSEFAASMKNCIYLISYFPPCPFAKKFYFINDGRIKKQISNFTYQKPCSRSIKFTESRAGDEDGIILRRPILAPVHH